MTQQYVSDQGRFLVASIDTADSVDVALIAGVAGQIIKVLAYELQTAGADTLMLKDGSTTFSGDGFVFTGSASISFSAPGGKIPLPMSAGANFTVNKTNLTQLSG